MPLGTHSRHTSYQLTEALCPLFTRVCVALVRQLANKAIVMDGMDVAKQQAVHDQLMDNSLGLVINCLNFDFIGTNPDESIEEVRGCLCWLLLLFNERCARGGAVGVGGWGGGQLHRC
jgi:hypothetical protein